MTLIFYTTFFEEKEFEVPFANVMHFTPANTEIGMIEHHHGKMRKYTDVVNDLGVCDIQVTHDNWLLWHNKENQQFKGTPFCSFSEKYSNGSC
jgi:hypothetical protein